MANGINIKPQHSWRALKKAVAAMANLKTRSVAFAFRQWCEDADKTRKACDEGCVVHKFTSTEVFVAAVAFFLADIGENVAIHHLRVARDRRRLKLANLRGALGKYDGFFLDEDEGDSIVPERLAVVRITNATRIQALQQVVMASRRLAESDDDGTSGEVPFPTSLGDGIQAFAADLANFIKTNGERGRSLIRQVCENLSYAGQVIDDEAMPPPVKFLAKIVIEAIGHNRLPEERKFGFGAGRS
jgi:hypothetical protein